MNYRPVQPVHQQQPTPPHVVHHQGQQRQEGVGQKVVDGLRQMKAMLESGKPLHQQFRTDVLWQVKSQLGKPVIGRFKLSA